MYENDPWAKLAIKAGFVPMNTESSARRAFDFCAPMWEVLEEIMTLQADSDGDVIMFTDENGFNPIIHRIGVALGVSKPLVIEVFPMNKQGSIADTRDELTHWDVLLRPDGGDPIVELEELTREEVDVKITELQAQYPFAEVNDDLQSLLQ